MSNLVSVSFRNATLFVTDINGQPYTPMKPIVEGMGLTWHGQFEKLNENKDRWGIRVIRIPTQGGQQDAVCLPLRKLPGWLMTIQPSRVKPEIRDNIIAYQNECDDVLWEHWNKQQPINPPALPTDLPTALRMYADQLERTAQLEQKITNDAPKVAFADQVSDCEQTYTMTELFGLLKHHTGQTFTGATLLQFLRQHGIACHPNKYSGVGERQFKPRVDRIGTWCVARLTPMGVTEWLWRPTAVLELINLINNAEILQETVKSLPPPELH